MTLMLGAAGLGVTLFVSAFAFDLEERHPSLSDAMLVLGLMIPSGQR